jgi:hypothetical protein
LKPSHFVKPVDVDLHIPKTSVKPFFHHVRWMAGGLKELESEYKGYPTHKDHNEIVIGIIF